MNNCANCGTELAGEFCHNCGQKAENPLRSARAFLSDVVGDEVHFHSSTVASLRGIFNPGFLTREYVAGRRVRYINPLQLYFLAATVFFLMSTLRPIVHFDPKNLWARSSIGILRPGGSIGRDDVRRMERRGMTLPLFEERFNNKVNANLPTLLIVSVILFTLLLWLFYIRHSATLLEHAVFALHWSAFFLLLVVGERLITLAMTEGDILPLLVTLTGQVYMLVALRRVYGQSWLVTLIKGTVIYLTFNIILGFWVVSTVLLAFESLL